MRTFALASPTRTGASTRKRADRSLGRRPSVGGGAIATAVLVALALSLAACAPFAASPAATPTASPVSSAPVYFLLGAEYRTPPWDIVALNGATGRVLWRHATGGGGESDLEPIAVGGVVYALTRRAAPVGVYASMLQAYRASDGALLWEYPIAGAVYQEPVIVGGLVYLKIDADDLHSPGVVVALRVSDGAAVWRASFPETFSALTVVSGLVIVSGDIRLTALSATTGAVVWNYTAAAAAPGAGNFFDPPIIVGSSLIVESVTSALDRSGVVHILAVTVGAGQTLWIAPISGSLSPLMLSGGKLYVTSTRFTQTNSQSTVYAVNPQDGTVQWAYPAPTNEVYSAPMAAGSDIAVAESSVTLNSVPSATGGGALALDGATGRLLWHTQLGAAVLNVSVLSPLVDGGVLYVFLNLTWGNAGPGVATFGQVAAMSLSDGALRWRKEIPSANTTPLVQGGALYTFTYNDHSPLGEVSAIRLGDGATLWQYRA